MKKVIAGILGALIALNASAINPPAITSPKPGVLQFSWTPPTTREDGTSLPASEITEYRLYLTNEAAFISIPAPATTYLYTVPVGYVTRSTDAAALSAVAGAEGKASPSVFLPAGITTPKSLPSAPVLTVK